MKATKEYISNSLDRLEEHYKNKTIAERTSKEIELVIRHNNREALTPDELNIIAEIASRNYGLSSFMLRIMNNAPSAETYV
jgi:hypothetical protein